MPHALGVETMNPLVSVVVSTYNQGWCIEQTLSSVLDQTYQPMEIIVVDDASTDDTSSRLQAFTGRITSLRHQINQGQKTGGGGASRNTGIRQARGEFVAFLDGDDLWEREKIAVQVQAALAYPQSGLIAVDGIRFDHHDGRVLQHTLFGELGTTLSDGAVWTSRLYDRLLQGCLIDTPSQVMVPARVFNAVGLFDGGIASDYDFYIRVAAEYDITLVKQSLTRYRYHASSVSGPLDRQHFTFAPINVGIWAKHAKSAREAYRPVIRQRMRQQMRAIADEAFHEGCRRNRKWASQYLCRLLATRLSFEWSPYIVVRLARLWCPLWIARIIKPFVRLVFPHKP
ncbi:MAG TPA: glycosyltransferase [Nitrospiraceae bacterium]|nr:glycosyltransferase [Nitrospiraceae bacterium]